MLSPGLVSQAHSLQNTKFWPHRLKLALLIAISLPLIPTAALSQVVPDGTLASPSIVRTVTTTTTITGGTTAGSNLFHSFDRFSVKLGDTAWFNNAASIKNIITRVTGSSASQIDGQLRANNSNLFFINPNGILFGSSAQLNIGGSFIGSTAQSVKFADGSIFSAIAPQTAPLLTVSLPIGLQYGANPAPILVQGPGHRLTISSSNFSINRSARPAGLKVQPGQTLALIGGDVNLNGGNLTAENGRVELGAVREAGLVKLIPTNPGWTVGYESLKSFGDIKLTEAASIDTSGNSGGEIRVQGRQVSLKDGSTLLATTLGAGQGRGITVKATDSLEVLGFSGSATQRFISSLFTDASLAATNTAQGGNITIDTGTLRVADGAQISASTLAAGNAGNLTVKANTIDLQGGVLPFGGGGLFSTVLNRTARGQGGSVQVETDHLSIRDGAKISVSTSGLGNAGQLNVQANSIDIVGRSASFGSSGLFARGSAGNGGNLMVKSDRLYVADGAQVAVSTSGAGRAGTLTVVAKEVDLVGIGVGAPSGLFASVQSRASGQGGDLMIMADRLSVRDGAQVVVSTAGSGKAGDLIVKAREVLLSGFSSQSRSGFFASAVVDTGNGGDVNVAAQRLTVQNGATISVSNFGSTAATPAGRGAAGNILINANAIDLKTNGTIAASTLAGSSGNIDIKSSQLVMQRNAGILTNSKGNEPGGNIKINSDVLVGVQNSDITANAVNAKGGRVTITSKSILGLVNRDRLTPDNDITATSDLGVSFNGTVQINSLDLNPANGIVELPNSLESQQISQNCTANKGSRFISTGHGGIAPSPSFNPSPSKRAWHDLRGVSAAIPAQPIVQTPVPVAMAATTIVEATTLQRNPNGTLELSAPTAIGSNRAISATCAPAMQD
jgi:filamentous hemagglutinin family protein